ncbi:MAG: GrpB family protein [Lachnospiraceae bacterium]|nr:GrpB family protein [Lachnospiraceae bacterium]
MSKKHVVVVPYDENWKQAFEDIKRELEVALGNLALRIEHVGSTSVEGLSAKPIIDIDVVIRDSSMLGTVIEALEKIDYRHEGDQGIPGREVFKYDGKEHLMKHHLYVCAEDAAELKRHLAFRDYLRSHPDDVEEYSRVKEEGAKLYTYDIDKYIEHKSPFIESIYERIKEENHG